MNEQQRFSDYAKRLRQMFPTWSKIRRDPNSNGAQFLSVVGMKLDDIEWMLEYAYEQAYIGTADLSQVDIVYKARIPNSLRPDVSYRLSSDSHILHKEGNLMTFLKNEPARSAIQYDTSYFIDFASKYVYVRQPFGKDAKYPDGYLMLTLESEDGDDIYSEPIPLMIHAVWNFFDEFGLLLDTPRLHGERNAAYKERILDVFRRPASSANTGLRNGIARELGLVHHISWSDAGTDLVLAEARIDPATILVDNETYPENLMANDMSGRIVLRGTPADSGIQKEVRYIAGIELHELHDETDETLQERLYTVDGHASNLLQYYVEGIRNHVPIMWGQWKWDQGFWNVADEEVSGFGYLPTNYDASFGGWKSYTPREG